MDTKTQTTTGSSAKASTPANLWDCDTLDLLTWVLGDGKLDIIEPMTNKRPSEVVRGTVTSELTRRLYSAKALLIKGGMELAANHAISHSADSLEHNCHAFHADLEKITNRLALLTMLYTAALREEHPCAASNKTSLCASWTLVSSEGEWDTTTPYRPGSQSRSVVRTLADIVTGKRTIVPETIKLEDRDSINSSPLV